MKQRYYQNLPAAILWSMVLSCCAVPFLFSAPAAVADLTTVSRINVVRIPLNINDEENPADVDRTVTVYSHGKQARTEVDGVLTSIFDGNNVYVLDDQAKTYYKTSLKSWLDTAQPMVGRNVSPELLSRADVDTSLDLDKSDETSGNQQTLVGLLSRKYMLSGWINLSPQVPDGGTGGGGHGPDGAGGGSGGQGGGGHDGGMGMTMAYSQAKNSAAQLRTVQLGDEDADVPGNKMSGLILSTTVSGEIWLANSVGYVGDKNNSAWAQALVSSWGVGQLTSGLASKISSQRALPTYALISFSWSQPLRRRSSDDGGFGASTHATATTTIHLTSISESLVDPTLFTVPSSYTKVSAPAAPAPQPAPAPGVGGSDSVGGDGASDGVDSGDGIAEFR